MLKVVRGGGVFCTFNIMAILIYRKGEVAYTDEIPKTSKLNSLFIN